MLRCCLKTLLLGLIDEDKDIITWKKENYSSLIVDNIKITSPSNGSSYEVGSNLTSDNIEVEKTITTTERYRLRKIVNGVETNPAEYQNNGEIYKGKVSTTSYVLDENAYEVSLTQL